MDGKWKVFSGVLAVLVLFVIAGCSFLPGDLEEGYIALNVGIPGGARSVETKQYDIDSLDLEVYGPDGMLLESFEWLPPESETYMVPGVGAGTYRVVVTHNGVNGDESLSITEELEFEIAVMTITVVRVVPGLLGVLEVEGSGGTDVTGYWTAGWYFEEAGFTFTPLYTYIKQDGTVIQAAHFMSGEIIGDTMIWGGEMEFGEFVDTTVYADDEFNGNFVFLDETGEVVVDTEMGLGLMQGTSYMYRTEAELFGDLSVSGQFMNYDEESGIGELVSPELDTSNALGFLEIDEEVECIGINFVDENHPEVTFYMHIAGESWATGTYVVSSEPDKPHDIWIDYSHVGNGVECYAEIIMSDAVVDISAIDADGVEGTLTFSGESNLTVSFNLPFAPPTPM